MDEFNAALPPQSDEWHALCIQTALNYPIRSRFPTDEPSPLTKAWVIRTATAIEVQLRQMHIERQLQKDQKGNANSTQGLRNKGGKRKHNCPGGGDKQASGNLPEPKR
jgi:hypothetical protein